MLKISRMKPILSFSSSLSNPLAAVISQLSPSFHSQRFIVFRRGKYLQNPSFLPPLSMINSSVGQSIQSDGGRSRGCFTEARVSGELHVIVGPMFAGKTTTLLRRIKSESCTGRSVAIIKSNKDIRYGLDSIVTHDGEKFACFPLADLSSFREKLGPEAYNKLEVIGIDEAQFFEDLYDFCVRAADLDGKIIIVAGLDGDYLRRSFGQILDIIPVADSVTKLTARCEVCGKRAICTLRKTDESKTELIAGSEVYMPVCRNHYISGLAVKEATKAVLDVKLSSVV